MEMVPLSDFVKDAMRHSPEALAELHTNPVLLQRDRFPMYVVSAGSGGGRGMDKTEAIDASQVRNAMDTRAGSFRKTAFVIELDEPEVTIGRSPDNTIFIPHPTTSTRHASLVRTSKGYQILDHGSTNGTYIGDERIEAETPVSLPDGHIISFSSLRFQYFEPSTFLAAIEKMIDKLGGREAVVDEWGRDAST